jgi:two-component system, OmpR family, sensor histidine kinase KdpD
VVRTKLTGSAIGTVAAIALGTAMLPWRSHLSIATPGLILVVPVVAGVIVGGYAAGIVSVTAGFLVYDDLFIPPYNRLSVGTGQDWVVLGVYVVVMLLVAQVAAHLKTARSEAQRREDEARRLFTLSELLVEDGSIDELLETIVSAIWTVFEVEGVALLLPVDEHLSVVASAGTDMTDQDLHQLDPNSGLPVRVGITGDAPDELRAVALTAASGPVGILALRGLSGSAADRAILGTFANHAALALERVQLRAQAARNELLEELDRVRRDLLGAVSHDLRTPLATMKVASSTLLDPEVTLSDGDALELYGLIDVQTDRLTRLVTSLLDMNRYQAGALRVDRRSCAVLDLVGEALAGLRPALGDRVVNLDLPGSLPAVEVDPVLIGQVLVNLLDNADRHSPPGQPIVVGAKARGARVALSVTDRGAGVPTEEGEMVFASFVHFDTGGRAGLGLAIAKTFVEAHGERIWVEDVPGGGARFVFTMPIAPGYGSEE